jgi:hypothetical protein
MQLKVTHTDRSGEELLDHTIAFGRTNASAVDGKQMSSASLDHEMTDSNAMIVNLNVKDVAMRSLVKKDSGHGATRKSRGHSGMANVSLRLAKMRSLSEITCSIANIISRVKKVADATKKTAERTGLMDIADAAAGQSSQQQIEVYNYL